MKVPSVLAGASVLLGAAALSSRHPSAQAPALTALVGTAGLVSAAGRARADTARWTLAVAVGALAVLSIGAIGAGAPPATRLAVLAAVLAAIAEEAFFRGLVYGWASAWGAGAAVAVSSALFAAVHVPAYGPGVLPVDLAAGVVFGWQRWTTGGWSASALTHVAANVIAMGALG